MTGGDLVFLKDSLQFLPDFTSAAECFVPAFPGSLVSTVSGLVNGSVMKCGGHPEGTIELASSCYLLRNGAWISQESMEAARGLLHPVSYLMEDLW